MRLILSRATPDRKKRPLLLFAFIYPPPGRDWLLAGCLTAPDWWGSTCPYGGIGQDSLLGLRVML